MSPSQEKEQALHLIGIATATILAIAAIVLAAACPPKDLTPVRAQLAAQSSQSAS
jgi:hypothetical protein